MTIDAFLDKYPALNSKNAYLERKFIYDVFHSDYGDRGLDLLEYQTTIHDESTGESYQIDFTFETESGKYAIETDGLYYHASGAVTAEYFDRLQRKQNVIVNQENYKLIRLTSNFVINNAKEAKYELRRALIADKTIDEIRRGMSDKIVPHEIQQEALDALDSTRQDGHKKGVVVIATGVGKTYLSAFDALRTNSEKILFIVHVKEILRQSRVSFEDVMYEKIKKMGFYHGELKEINKDIIFSSIQTIGRDQHIKQFDPEYFDYIIVDETHHVAAESYAKIFEYFKPKKFFLGLTATPERMDKKEILSFFNNNLVYEIDQKTAIDKALLVPYKYFGFKDNVDYTDIRWSGFKYNVQDLNKALMIERRDRAILEKFNLYTKERKTIGFCVSIEHAEYMSKLFNKNGIKSIAIHSKENDDIDLPKETTEKIKAFRRGEYQVAFVVDMFNEGIDVKDVECLLFLRPTESKTIFIQQMGRGLRTSPKTNKADVVILDFIGNYKTAINILSGLGLGDGSLRNFKPSEDPKEREQKLLYNYDNNGSTVYFQDEVVDVLKEIQSASTKEVRNDLIDDEWREYADFLKNASKDNLYFKVGQQNKDIESQLSALKIIETNPEITDDEFKEYLKDEEITGMTAGFRALFLSKIMGLIKEGQDLTNVYTEIKNRVNSNNSNFGVIGHFEDILTRQLEKVGYWNPVYGSTNKYRSTNEQVDYNQIQTYVIPLINLVIAELNTKYGYKDFRLSKEEINYFIVFAINMEDYQSIAEMISRYREYAEKPELRKLLEQSTVKADFRVQSILKYVQYYDFSNDGIKINDDFVNKVLEETEILKRLLNDGKLIKPGTDSDRYLEMLYSNKSMVNFHLGR